MLKNSVLYIIVLFFLPSWMISQDYNQLFPLFYQNGNRMELANSGGLRNGKFSNIDFNGDGVKDIYVYDRTAARSLCFINNNDEEGISFSYAPEYEKAFPKMNNWALLHDFNKDGFEDIFCLPTTPGIPGIEVWRGGRSGNFPTFQKMKTQFFDIIPVPVGNAFTNLYNALTDIPAIIDVDGDGDTDILSFELDGSYLNYHKNMAMEKGLGLDTFVMETTDICFGKFYENMFSEEIKLSSNNKECASSIKGVGSPRHSGSTVFAFDHDCDGDKDLLLGDIANTRLTFLHNGGNAADAWMTSQDLNFPSYDTPVNMSLFIAAFYVDVNNDGKRDLIATPNETDGGENNEHIWLYLNTGTDCSPVFELYTKHFLIDEIISIGAKSDAAFGDLTGDGIPDLLLSGNGISSPVNGKKCRMNLYKNTGSLNQPEFTLFKEDYLNFSVLSNFPVALSPELADMDNDGDLDLWVGDGNGRLYYFTNTAGAGNEAEFTYAYPFNNIFVGQDAKPSIFDVNADGLPDLLVGEQNNELNLFLNKGSAEMPVFGNLPDQRNYGQLFSGTDFSTFNNSISVFEYDGKRMAYIGFEDGRLSLYEWSGDLLTGKWMLVDQNVDRIHRGNKLTVEVSDLNDDGRLDLILGNFGGGVQFFATPFNINETNVIETNASDIMVYPNPFGESLSVKGQPVNASFQLYDLKGVSVKSGLLKPLSDEINTMDLCSGFYILCVTDHNGVICIHKVVK